MSRIGFLASACALALAVPATAPAQDAQVQAVSGTRLDVVATGEVTRVPDIVHINAGVSTQAPTATAAIQQNARQMESVRAALRRAGVADRDIQTSSINLHPEWRHSREGVAEFGGYRANNQVRVRFRDIANAGRILDALVTAGANNVDGPMLAIERPGPALDEARADAIRVARERAELYARALGMRVVRILSVSEAGAHHMPPPMFRGEAIQVTGGGGSTQIDAGEQVVAASVTVSFELR